MAGGQRATLISISAVTIYQSLDASILNTLRIRYFNVAIPVASLAPGTLYPFSLHTHLASLPLSTSGIEAPVLQVVAVVTAKRGRELYSTKRRKQ